MLDVSNINKTLNASRGLMTTGSSGAAPVDGRTITEKYADIDALKVMIRGQLKEITDGQNAQDIVYELTTNELEFLAGMLPFIITDLKPKFQLGVPAEIFIPYLRKLMRKTIETQGVEYGLQEGGGGPPGGGGLPPPGPNNIMPVEAFAQFMYDLDDILAVAEEGDLQSVGSFASSLAPSEASSRYSQPPIDFGVQFGPPAALPIRPSILRMRDMIIRDMQRIIRSWPSIQDVDIMIGNPDPFLAERYYELIALFADTLPNLQQMNEYRDDLERAIGDNRQTEAESIIREWSAIVSNVDYNIMEDAKALVRQAQEVMLGLDAVAGDEELFPNEDPFPFLEEEDERTNLEEYFASIQAAPASVSSYLTRGGESLFAGSQSGGPASSSASSSEGAASSVASSINIMTYEDFTKLTLREKRDFLTLVGEMLPDGGLDTFFDELSEDNGNVFRDDILEILDRVYPLDEDAEGGTSDDLDAMYDSILKSETFMMNPGEILLDDPDEIASLPQPEFQFLFTRAEVEEMQRRARGGDQKELRVTLPEQLPTPDTATMGIETPISMISGARTPTGDFSGRASDLIFTGNGIRKCGTGMCGNGMCGCSRCKSKMKAGKLPVKKRNIILGRGIAAPKVTARVIPSNIDLSLGVKAEPAYVSFGKHLINKHRLMKDDVLMLRTLKGGAILNVPTQRISKNLSKVLKTIIGGGNPDFESLNVLTDGDKEVLYNISKTSRISHSVPNPNKSSQEKEDSRFELLKGQIASGQDNKDAIKEFKLLLIKMMNQKRIPKGQGIDILTEMAAMGL
jgi:hypothetical protein